MVGHGAGVCVDRLPRVETASYYISPVVFLCDCHSVHPTCNLLRFTCCAGSVVKASNQSEYGRLVETIGVCKTALLALLPVLILLSMS